MVAHPFTPPNRAALWASLALTKEQLAALCGLSRRQVAYWTARGYLPRSPRNPARYSGDAVDMADDRQRYGQILAQFPRVET